uniref:Amino acid transporter transmembrane domain-containing protein n=1 Tax=Meloidogyne floridensis TaxID=298350 RepID=A0A915NNM0_9BILA
MTVNAEKSNGGLNWFVTGLFIVAQLAGGGIVALPTAVIQSGLWTGIFLNILLTIMACSTSIMLGKCWLILQRRWPVIYKDNHCREPYPEICMRALGPRFKNLASICIQLNQFGICVVFLLLSSKNIQHFLKAFFDINFSFCLLILILALLLFPFTLLKSPEDFWWAAVLSAGTTTIAVILICFGTLMDSSVCAKISVGMPPNNKFSNYFLALGTFLFSYGGHPGFPTIQHDMKKPKEFTKASIIAFLKFGPFRIIVRGIVLFLVVLVAESIPTFGPLLDLSGGSTQTSTALIYPCICYLFLNASEQKYKLKETNKNIKIKFNENKVTFYSEYNEYATLKDVLTISDKKILFLSIFIIVFGILGGGAATFTAIRELTYTHFVPPCYISVFMDKQKNEELFKFGIFGILGGGAATFTAIRELTYTHFVPPCYISAFMDKQKNEVNSLLLKELFKFGSINCCGPNQNISIFGPSKGICSETNLNFYN